MSRFDGRGPRRAITLEADASMIDALDGSVVTITDLGDQLRSGGRFRVTNTAGIDVTMSVLATVVGERLVAGALASDRPGVGDPGATALKRLLGLAARTAATTTQQAVR